MMERDPAELRQSRGEGYVTFGDGHVKYSSVPDTLEHIAKVQGFLNLVARWLMERGVVHDQSKLESPEVEVFDEFTPKLKGLTYGSPEYKACTAAMGEALKHHYAHNSHHPEHYADGVRGFDLLDLVEMFCDWKAASMRHDDGDIHRSIDINAERFEMGNVLRAILHNTATRMGWDRKEGAGE